MHHSGIKYDVSSPSCLVGISGNPIGWLDSYGYYYVATGGRKLPAHRIVMELHGVNIEGLQVDHINGNRKDNRFCNLRVATQSENLRNCKLSKANTSGTKGVSWHKQRSKWTVRVRVDGVYKSFGLYADYDEACRVANSVREEHHGRFARHG